MQLVQLDHPVVQVGLLMSILHDLCRVLLRNVLMWATPYAHYILDFSKQFLT